MAQHCFRNIPLIPVSVTDTNRIIAMSFSRLVADDLHSIELQDCTRRADTGLGVEDGRHALFDS